MKKHNLFIIGTKLFNIFLFMKIRTGKFKTILYAIKNFHILININYYFNH